MKIKKQYLYSEQIAKQNGNQKYSSGKKSLFLLVYCVIGFIMLYITLKEFVHTNMLLSIIIIISILLGIKIMLLFINKNDIISTIMYLKLSDNGYYIVNAGKGINSMISALTYVSSDMDTPKDFYNSKIEHKVSLANHKLQQIRYGLELDHDFTNLTQIADFCRIVKVYSVQSKQKYYILNIDAEMYHKRKVKNTKKNIKIYKAYDNIDEFIQEVKSI